MTRHFRHIIIVWITLLAAFSISLQAQIQIKIPITITDANNKSGTIWLGWHPGSTFCIDSTIYLKFAPCDSIKEYGLPPPPPAGVFDARFIEHRSGLGACLDQGMPQNIRPFVSSVTKDTFKLGFQPSITQSSSGYPIRISWPSNLSQHLDSAKLRYTDPEVGTVQVNMFSQTSFSISTSDLTNFSIFCWNPKGTQTPPSSPTLVSPANGTTNQPTSLTLSWASVPNAVLYRVDVATDSLFTSSSTIYSDTTSATSKIVSGLTDGYKLFWRVAAYSIYAKGCPSAPFSFITAFNTPPTLSFPANAATGVPQTANLRWRKIFGATNYHIQISKNSTFTDLEIEFDETDTTTTTVPLDKCLDYYWRVQASTPYETSPYSSSRMFTVVDEIPTAPLLLGPPDSAVVPNDRPLLSWDGDSCTRSFTVQIAWDADFTNIIESQTIPGLTFQPQPLEGQESYYWRVQGINGQNVPGGYSDTLMFTTGTFPPRPPMLLLPGNTVIIPDTFTLLQWNKPPNKPTSYTVDVDTAPSFNTSRARSFSNVSDTVMPLDLLMYCTKFYWRVRGSNTAGPGNYSATFSFDVRRNIPNLPVIDSPAVGDTGIIDEPTLRWHGDNCTQTFQIQVSLDSNFSELLYEETTTGTTLAILADNPLTKYYWRVRAGNEIDYGAYAVGYFTTVRLTRPKPPVLNSPPNNALNVIKNPTVCWDSSKRTETYRLQVAVDSNFTTLVFNDSTLTALCQQLGPLLYSKTYYWRVNAKNAAGTSDYSVVRKFSTLFPPDSVSLLHPPDGATGVSVEPLVQWSIPDRAERYQLQVARDPEFGVIIYNDTSIQTQSWQVYNLNGRTDYYWRVRARNAAGVGPWSATNHFTTTVVGVANWVIKLAVSETGFGQDTVYFGFHPNATHGIDPQIGEFEMPPPFIGQFESRFIDNPNRPGLLGEGLRLNLHPFVTYTQVDTFHFSFQLGTGEYPVHVTWNSEFVRSICDSMKILDLYGGLNLYERMDLVSSATVTNISTTSLLIITYGALPAPTDAKDDGRQVPEGFTLSQNYPNPFNPETRIEFSNEKPAMIYIGVYDVLGREVTLLMNAETYAGIHSVNWDGKNQAGMTMPSGIYYARMIATTLQGEEQAFIAARTMILMK